jgi:uncharacterized DUF497 family protein
MITWDEKKRIENLREHGIDLAACESFFDGPMISEDDAREAYGELRTRSFGLLHGRVVLLVWTERQDVAHLISCREADKHETREFWKEAL